MNDGPGGAVERDSLGWGPIANGTVFGSPGSYDWNQAEWTVLWDGRVPYTSEVDAQAPWEIYDSDEVSYIRLHYRFGTDRFYLLSVEDGSTIAYDPGAVTVPPFDGKVCLGFAEANHAISITGGAQGVTNTPGEVVPAGLDALSLGGGIKGASNGSIFTRALKIWRGRKTDAQLESLVGN